VKKFAQKNITTLVGDMTHESTHTAVKKYFSDMGLRRCDLITSDVAPNTTGRNDDDQYNSSMLCLEVIKIADKFLAPGGNLVMKIFVGRDLNRVLDQAKNKFKIVKCIKPEACRDRSFEEYVVCKGYRG
jgi:23S rRNA (uridine2552-2'-O)-methyltransferase